MGDIDPRISPLQADVDGLTNTLEERDRFIQKLSDDLVLQKNKTLELEAQLAEKEAALLPSDAETSRRTIRSSALLGESALDFSKSREEIEQLELALKDSLSESQKNTALVSEMSGLRLDRDLATNQLALQTTELASVKSQLQSIQMVNEDLAARLLRETQAASAATTALDVIKQRVDLSFTASQLSGYLTQAIDSFSREANSGGLSVNYVINEMEVTFKASLTKNDTGEMTLAAPSLASGDEALSTIKFSVMAIPKKTNDDEQ